MTVLQCLPESQQGLDEYLTPQSRRSSAPPLHQRASDGGAGASRLGVFEEGIPARTNQLIKQQDTSFSSASSLTLSSS